MSDFFRNLFGKKAQVSSELNQFVPYDEAQKTFLQLKSEDDNFEVEYEIILPEKVNDKQLSEQRLAIHRELDLISDRTSINEGRIAALNAEIDRLTNTADGFDYMIAVSCGILTGIVDSFFVGEFDFDGSKGWSNQQVNNMVMSVAKKEGYTGNRLSGAIKKIEEKYKYAGDGIYQKTTGLSISNKSHHIDDFRHHPTIIGLIFSLITQFSPEHNAYFSNRYGEWVSFAVAEDGELIGNSFKEKIIAGTINWAKHLVSDMSGSNKTSGTGMGLPGPILSTLKEISALPVIRDTQLSEKVNDLFVNKRFNLQSELAVGRELTKQAFPVILNEALVRAFYFIRHFGIEYRHSGDLNSIPWEKVMPGRNRTLLRMITISSGTFVAMDLADAAIRSTIKSGGINPATLPNFILRVNFVGIGRFAVALGTDVGMGVKREELRNERMQIYMEQIHLCNAKVFYKQANMWISAREATKAINEASASICYALDFYVESTREVDQLLNNIGTNRSSIMKKNSKLLKDILEEL